MANWLLGHWYIFVFLGFVAGQLTPVPPSTASCEKD